MQKIRCCVRKLVQCNFLVVQSLFKLCKSVVNLSVFSLLRDLLSSCCVLYHFHVVDCFFVFEQLDQDIGMCVLLGVSSADYASLPNDWLFLKILGCVCCQVFLQLTMPAFQMIGCSWVVCLVVVPQMSVAFNPVGGDVFCECYVPNGYLIVKEDSTGL